MYKEKLNIVYIEKNLERDYNEWRIHTSPSALATTNVRLQPHGFLKFN